MDNGFTFFRSYYVAAKLLADPLERVQLYDAICAYALDEIVPEFSSDSMKAMFALAKPNLDKSRARAKAGSTRHGTGEGERPASNENKPKQTETNEIKPKQTKSNLTEKEIGVGEGIGDGIGDGNGTGDRNKEKDQEDSFTLSDDKVRRTPSDLDAVVTAWNRLGLNQIQKINPMTDRYKMTKCRIRDYGQDTVLKAIAMVADSDFLMGRAKDFVATFDWFIRPNNFDKVLSGNYANHSAPGRQPEKSWAEIAAEMEAEMGARK